MGFPSFLASLPAVISNEICFYSQIKYIDLNVRQDYQY